jgi:uncharacterized membrane protein
MFASSSVSRPRLDLSCRMIDQLLAFVGRTHPLVLHMPIGFFAALSAFEGLAKLQGRPLERHVRLTLASLLVLSASVSVATGLLLSRESGYGGETLDNHKLMGIAFACSSAYLLVSAARQHTRRYWIGLAVCGGIMTVAGHLGATLSHGEDFLTAPFKTPAKREVNGDPEASASRADVAIAHPQFDRDIKPMLASMCVSCHSESKSKGGLALHTPEAIMKGGEDGAAIVAGDPDASDLIRRMELPGEDEDHMPPRKKAQPTAAQIQTLRAWIKDGARFDASAAPSDASVPKKTSAAPAGESPLPAAAASPPAAALDALRDANIHVEPVEPGAALLAIDCTPAAGQVDAAALTRLLEPLAPHIANLSVARMQLDESVVATIGRMSNLDTLNASASNLTDAHLATIASLPSLRMLMVTQTHLSEACVASLGSMKSLSAIFAWKSGLTAESLRPIAAKGVRIDLGDLNASKPLETETAVKLSSNAPPPVAAAATIKAVNATCPLSDKPVNPDVVIVYKGRPIGFCCTKCATEFLAHPDEIAAKVK